MTAAVRSIVCAVIIFGLMAPQISCAAVIVVGEVAPFSGLDANQARAYAAGMQLYFNNVNRASASNANNHTFTLVRKDDGGRPEDTVNLTKSILSEDRPLVLAGYFGSRNISDLLASGLLEKERIALVGYRSGDIRNEAALLYSVRAGPREEIKKLGGHLSILGLSRWGLFYEDGPGAIALITAAEEAARQAGASIIVKASYPADTARISAAIPTMTLASPQVIIMVASSAAAAGFIEQYRTAGGSAQLFALSGTDIEQLTKRLSETQMQGVAISQVTPNPYKLSGRLSKELNDTLAAFKDIEVPVSYAMMEGFITAKVIVEAVRRQGARPTRLGTINALNAMENFDVGGYSIGYRPGMLTGSKFVELSIISSSGKIRQ